MDDQDDIQSRHSIGIVENPLYAENDDLDTPSYAALSEKEKEAEVNLHLYSMYRQSYSCSNVNHA